MSDKSDVEDKFTNESDNELSDSKRKSISEDYKSADETEELAREEGKAVKVC